MRNAGFVFSTCFLPLVSLLPAAIPMEARSGWTELNLGPFYVDTDADEAAARNALTQLEQLRWVLGGLLESQDLPSLWPIHILLTNSQKTNPSQFVSQNAPSLHSVEFVPQFGSYIFVVRPGDRLPLSDIAGLLLDANTPHLPPDVEWGLRQLLGTLEAKGSRVSWGGAPPHPDLAWARVHLFATKFEYSLSFHIFLTALKGGIDLRAAEKNAFGKDPAALESEAATHLASGNWQPVSVSGRPLDPKRDFGQHALDDAVAGVYLASLNATGDPAAAEAAYKAAINAGGAAKPLGFEGLAQLAVARRENPKEFLDNAIHSGSRNAAVYLEAADGLAPAQALPLLKRAAQMNPAWSAPLFEQAQIAPDPAAQEELLKRATRLQPRLTEQWVALAKLETARGEATQAQGSWLQAEDSAPTEAEHTRVHKLRLDSEGDRLDNADRARLQDREAVHRADQQAQGAEQDRIKAAEEKANRALDRTSGVDKPDAVVPWNEMVPQKTLRGTLTQVDCLRSSAQLTVMGPGASQVRLLLENVAKAGLACGVQKSARRVVVSYLPQPDERFGTSGTVTSLELH